MRYIQSPSTDLRQNVPREHTMSREKKSRIATSHEASPLTDSPFAALSREGLPAGEAAPTDCEPAASDRPYTVSKTAKGGYHLSVEKRAAGKVVTLVHGVQGDGEALARALKKACGVGGTFAGEVAELQGNVRNKVETLLKELLA
jgi:translation initiation factor 1